MIVRALDINGDWTFGRSKADYLSEKKAVAQMIRTRLKSFLGDCFFDLEAGIDWFNLLGSKLEIELRLGISSTIMNTPDVKSLKELTVSRGTNRVLLVQYSVETIYGEIRQQDNLDL